MTVFKGKIAGDVTFKKGDDAKQVTSIGGYLDVRDGATCDLPQVTSIGGYLYVRDGATCDLPQVTSIGGSLYVSPGATCDLPQVTSIGGYPIPDKAEARARMAAIADVVLADPNKLTMDSWHSESGGCGTTHCIAGWAVHLEPDGYALEKACGGTLTAGNVLLGPDYSRLFFVNNGKALTALADIKAEHEAAMAGGE